MATIKLYDPICENDGCSLRATREVSDDSGATVGKYCTKHANARAHQLMKEERAKQKAG